MKDKSIMKLNIGHQILAFIETLRLMAKFIVRSPAKHSISWMFLLFGLVTGALAVGAYFHYDGKNWMPVVWAATFSLYHLISAVVSFIRSEEYYKYRSFEDSYSQFFEVSIARVPHIETLVNICEIMYQDAFENATAQEQEGMLRSSQRVFQMFVNGEGANTVTSYAQFLIKKETKYDPFDYVQQ